jgi:hypothetical protein
MTTSLKLDGLRDRSALWAGSGFNTWQLLPAVRAMDGKWHSTTWEESGDYIQPIRELVA